MDITKTTTAMSSSLLARNVYAVCFPERENPDILRDELATARKKFFDQGKKTVRVGKADVLKGYEGRLKGKLTRRSLYWRKTMGKLTQEESFEQRNGAVIVRRDLQGLITTRLFFDRSQIWIKSEYYDPWDTVNPAVIFKPVAASDLVERFDWDEDQKRYHSTELHPLPYLSGTAEQSILNARFGDPSFIVSTGEGEFCYCPKKDAQDRLRALDEIKDGTIVLMPAWEVKDGALAGEEGEEETEVSFTSLEEYAKIEPEHETEPETQEPPAPPEIRDTLEFAVITEPEEELFDAPAEEPVTEPPAVPPVPDDLVEFRDPSDEREPEELEEIAEKILSEAEPEPAPEAVPEEQQPAPAEEPEVQQQQPETPALAAYAAGETVRDGQVVGKAGQLTGLTAYEGEYLDGRREGFGVHYDRNGSLSYAGSWKDDKKNGLGVSFRDTDHALHISAWENGKPGDYVTLFDKDGTLRYSGRIIDGKKEGAGVSVNPEDGTIFIGKWEHGQSTGFGSSFDQDGNLLYYGGWKDGKRHGHGTEFDGSGGIVFDGEWKDGKYHNGILYQKLSDNDSSSESPSWD